MYNFRKLWVKEPQLSGLSTGEAGERWAEYLYRLKGYRILARNYEVSSPKKLGELDLVCCQGKELVFVEVKTRRDEKFMDVMETVHWHKQALLKRMVYVYLMKNPQYENWDLRIDVAGIIMDPFDNSVKSVNIIENAIEEE